MPLLWYVRASTVHNFVEQYSLLSKLFAFRIALPIAGSNILRFGHFWKYCGRAIEYGGRARPGVYSNFLTNVSYLEHSLSKTVIHTLLSRNLLQLINLLANALPAQSNYFLQILVVAMVVTMSTELLRVVPLFLALLRRFVGPNLTEKERTKRWKFLTPLEDPREFEFANNSGSVVLYFMVYFVYAYLAPICCFFLVVCFFIMETGYRYQFYHNYPPTPDSGGKHWKGFLYIIEAEMIFAQLTLIGFLLLKRSFYAIPFMTPLIACTILFIIYVNRYQLQVTNYLPTSACVKVDNLYRLQDFEFAKGVYVQPCIAEAQSEEIFEII